MAAEAGRSSYRRLGARNRPHFREGEVAQAEGTKIAG
jgi:hypothetical protein